MLFNQHWSGGFKEDRKSKNVVLLAENRFSPHQNNVVFRFKIITDYVVNNIEMKVPGKVEIQKKYFFY